MSKKVTLLQCGSFNPPHLMHLRSQELAKIHLEKLQRTVIAGWMSPVSDGYRKTGLGKDFINHAMKKSSFVGRQNKIESR